MHATMNIDTIGHIIRTQAELGNRPLLVVDRHRIRLRVFERGVGETLACGSGACAAVVTGVRRGLLDGPVDVHTRGGVLTVQWSGESVFMTGPAEHVFSGEIEI